MWASYHKTFEYLPLGKDQAPVVPTDRELDKCEQALNFKLPESFREFLKTFGVGELFSYYRIYGTGFPEDKRNLEYVDLAAYDASYRVRTSEDDFDNYNDPELAQRIIVFCSTMDGHNFGWDPKERRKHKSGEPGIYLVPRHSSDTPCVATSFKEFVMDVLEFGGECKFLGGKVEKWKRTYRPDGKPMSEQS